MLKTAERDPHPGVKYSGLKPKDPVTSHTSPPHALRWWIGLSALAIVVLDQGTKWWAESTLVLREYHPVIGELLGWKLIYNPGAAFGLASDATWILTLVAAVAVVALVVIAFRTTQVAMGIGIAGMLGGAISHLGDRLLREPGFGEGHIVDFIDYAGFFIGNIADIFLVSSALYLVALSLFQKDPVTPDEPPAGSTP
jgi:signal peptidase II